MVFRPFAELASELVMVSSLLGPKSVDIIEAFGLVMVSAALVTQSRDITLERRGVLGMLAMMSASAHVLNDAFHLTCDPVGVLLVAGLSVGSFLRRPCLSDLGVVLRVHATSVIEQLSIGRHRFLQFGGRRRTPAQQDGNEE
jgi:hypothetical protein